MPVIEVKRHGIQDARVCALFAQARQPQVERQRIGQPKIDLIILPADTDNDGMPDEFEDKYGLDKNDPADAMKIASNGYTNIENYIFLIK